MFLVCGDYSKLTGELTKRFASRYTAAYNLFISSPVAKRYQVVNANPASFDEYNLAHSAQYVETLKRIISSQEGVDGIPLEGVQFEQVGVGGTLTAAILALKNNSFAYHLGGGYHHGMPNSANGIDFCNDVAITLKYLLRAGLKKILYVDLDAHYPDGVQTILMSESRIMQVSMHQQIAFDPFSSYSFIGKDGAVGKILNMPLPHDTGDFAYLCILKKLLRSVMASYKPDCVFYQSGVDPYYKDPIGCLNLSLNALYQRDTIVKSVCVSAGTPFVTVLGGGYHPVSGPKAIINSLAALSGEKIVFDEPESMGTPAIKKAFKIYDQLRICIGKHIDLEPITNEERKR